MQRKVTAAGPVERAPGEARHAEAAEDAKSAEERRPEAPSTLQPKLFGAPVFRILSRAGGETVGYLYEWDNGERQPLWLSDPVEDVRYVPLQQPVSPPGDDPSRT